MFVGQVWDPETQSALMFGGEAANTFQYFADLWRYDWPSRTWSELSQPGPAPRSGHSAVWDPASRTMVVFGGRHLADPYSEIWAYRLERRAWELWTAPQPPTPRIYHAALWDSSRQAMLVFGGEHGDSTLQDLQHFSVAAKSWMPPGAPAPNPRSRHTVVWDATTHAMLVFGGWDGQQYLSSLQRYDAWADSWADLAAVGTASPWPRGFHVAAWNAITRSLLVFGGIQNSTESQSLSYDDGLYSFSLLTRTWTELGRWANIPGPSARAHSSMVFDAASPALLLFGGFDASYLRELWRYVMSAKASVPVLRCQLGQPCSLDEKLMVKQACQDPGGFSGGQGLAGTRLFVEPGTYDLCGCDGQNCSEPTDFGAARGHFIAEGPYTNQSASCYIGLMCTVPAWKGVGVSSNDSLIVRKDCRSMQVSVYSGIFENPRLTKPFMFRLSWRALNV